MGIDIELWNNLRTRGEKEFAGKGALLIACGVNVSWRKSGAVMVFGIGHWGTGAASQGDSRGGLIGDNCF